MTGISKHHSVIAFHVNDLNPSIKKQRLAGWIKIKKKDPVICFQETHFIGQDYYRQSQRTDFSPSSKWELKTLG